jgi:hypothetical protein
MSHFNFESLKNDWSAPAEARPKVKKPTPKTDDSHVTHYGREVPNPKNTPITRLGEPYDRDSGQLEKHAAKRIRDHIAQIIVEAYRQGAADVAACTMNPPLKAGELAQQSTATLIATHASAGLLEAGPGHDVGARPAHDRSKEAEVMGADYSENDMDKMEPVGHIGEATSYLDDVSGCQNCDDGKCEACRGNFNRAMAHLSRFAEKVGDSDGDDGERDDSPLGESGEKVLRTFDEANTADLESAAVSIARNTRKPGESHLAPMPRRTVK